MPKINLKHRISPSRQDPITVLRVLLQERIQDLRLNRITISKDLLPRVIRSPQVIDLLQSPRLTEMPDSRDRDPRATDLRVALTRITRAASVRPLKSPLVSRTKSPSRVALDVIRTREIRMLPRSISSPLQSFVSRPRRVKRA